MTAEVRAHLAELQASGTPHVLAIVVRAERPTSAKPGDRAVIHADGTIVGFVGGDCAESSVRTQALAALARGEPVLVRIRPDDDGSGQARPVDGVVTVHNPCLSGGTLEIFLEPTSAPRRIAVVGSSPIGQAVADLARHLGYQVATQVGDGPMPEAVIVASHGDDEAEPLTAALRGGVGYIGLVASRLRGPSVLESLDLADDDKSRIHTPAGLDIDAHTPGDIAVSILAEIIASRSRSPEPAVAQTPATAIDPVCGMTVVAVDTTLHADVDGVRYWFCAAGCRTAFLANPSAYAAR
jgi:xanthine dehydrogenase accessory factor